MLELIWWSLAVISFILAIFFGFMAQKWSGKRRYNEAMINIGEGSFSEKIKTNIMFGVYWGLTALSLIGILYCVWYKIPQLYPSDKPSAQSNNNVITLPKSEANSDAPIKTDKNATSPTSTNDVKSESINQQAEKPKTYTPEEIQALEKEKQYSGDDPVIRQRLGLPPKP